MQAHGARHTAHGSRLTVHGIRRAGHKGSGIGSSRIHRSRKQSLPPAADQFWPETLQRVDSPGESLVVSKWQSADYWQLWQQSQARSEIQAKIDQLLGEETVYEIYEFD